MNIAILGLFIYAIISLIGTQKYSETNKSLAQFFLFSMYVAAALIMMCIGIVILADGDIR